MPETIIPPGIPHTALLESIRSSYRPSTRIVKGGVVGNKIKNRGWVVRNGREMCVGATIRVGSLLCAWRSASPGRYPDTTASCAFTTTDAVVVTHPTVDVTCGRLWLFPSVTILHLCASRYSTSRVYFVASRGASHEGCLLIFVNHFS